MERESLLGSWRKARGFDGLDGDEEFQLLLVLRRRIKGGETRGGRREGGERRERRREGGERRREGEEEGRESQWGLGGRREALIALR
jgi:hypothetical protein